MKNKILLILATLFVCVNGLFSQVDSARRGKLVLKYAPLNILDPNLTTLQFGLEYYLSDRYSLQIEYGQKIPFSDSSSLRSSFKGGNGFRVKMETHYYVTANSIFNFPFSILESVIGKVDNKYVGIEALPLWTNCTSEWDTVHFDLFIRIIFMILITTVLMIYINNQKVPSE